MLCCFSTSISDIQAKTKVVTAQTFWALEDPCCRCIWLQGYWFRAQKQRKINSHLFFVFYPMLCCFSTPISDVQAKTRWWQHGFLPNVVLFFNSDLWCSSRDKGDDNTDFVSFGRSLPQMSKLQGYLFKAQKWKANFIVFFSFVQCFVTISWENI